MDTPFDGTSNKEKNRIRKKNYFLLIMASLMFSSLLIFFISSSKFNSSSPSPSSPKILLSKPNKNPLILALGDSICYGGRNQKKGFIGDLGYPYVNIGVSGATLSTKNPDKVNIPTQLVNYHDSSTSETPDIIISNGGVNDYYWTAALGTVPQVAVKTDEEAEKLDRSTILGSLEYLFYKMIKFYPKAYRFFLLGHKTTFKYSRTNATIVDWSVTKNPAGYTQTELYESFKQVCQIYNVEYIDVFNEGIINSAFDEYISDVPYTEDHNVTYKFCVDNDRVHPLDYGYRVGYVPLIKKAMEPYLELFSEE